MFDFDYTREIYTPAIKRKFGYYVLPLLYGGNFIGRAEIIAERKTGMLVVKNIWYENGVKQTIQLTTALNSCFQKFALFNGCETISTEAMN
ncbi:DNA glycosylase AlkZ-like family protein [Bacillus sp. C1]